MYSSANSYFIEFKNLVQNEILESRSVINLRSLIKKEIHPINFMKKLDNILKLVNEKTVLKRFGRPHVEFYTPVVYLLKYRSLFIIVTKNTVFKINKILYL